MNRIIFTLCLVAISLGVTISTVIFFIQNNSSLVGKPATENIQEILHTVYDHIGPVTVSLTAQKNVNNENISRAGTGIIVGSRGLILTNKHLVGEEMEYTVELDNGTKFPAKLIKIHPTLDLALLEILSNKPLSLPVGKFVESQASIRRGDIVIALSNALGLYPHTLSQGIIAGTNRTVSLGNQTMTGLIQTSIPLSIGSSGGPLVREDNIIIGINTGIVGGSSQIGWTLPLTQEEVVSFIGQ